MIHKAIRSVLAIAVLAMGMILSVSLAMVMIPIVLVGAYFAKRKFNQIVAAQQSQMGSNSGAYQESIYEESVFKQKPSSQTQQNNGRVIEAEYIVVDDNQ